MMNRRKLMKSMPGSGTTIGIVAGVIGLGVATAMLMKKWSHQ